MYMLVCHLQKAHYVMCSMDVTSLYNNPALCRVRTVTDDKFWW